MFLGKKQVLFEVLLPVQCMKICNNPNSRAVETGSCAIVVSLMVAGEFGGELVDGKLLGELIERYGVLLNAGTVTSSPATIYQAPGQSLRKRSIRVSPEVWQKWKMLAFAHGVSVSLLFSMLLRMDLGGVGEVCRVRGNVAVPTFPLTLTAAHPVPQTFFFKLFFGPPE